MKLLPKLLASLLALGALSATTIFSVSLVDAGATDFARDIALRMQSQSKQILPDLGFSILRDEASLTAQIVDNIGLLDKYLRNDFAVAENSFKPPLRPRGIGLSETQEVRVVDEVSAVQTGHVLSANTAATSSQLLSTNIAVAQTPSDDDHIRSLVASYLLDPSVREQLQGPIGQPGPPGPKGDTGSAPAPIQPTGWSGITPYIIPPNPAAHFNGLSLFSATDLSSNNFWTDSAKITMLTVSGNSTLSGNLSVSGTITGSVSGSINPGLTAGSVIFQGASGLAQDNANFFWDDTNNRLGIGTTTPANPLNLFANDTSFNRLFIQQTGTGRAGLRVQSTASDYIIEVASTFDAANLLFFDNSPSGANAYVFKIGSNQIAGRDGTAALPGYSFISDIDTGMYRPASNILGFSTAGSERLRIDSAGNVGIGTTGPTGLLDVNGVLQVTKKAYVAPTGSGGLEFAFYTSDQGGIISYDRAAATYRSLALDGSNILLNSNSNGNVGIGTTSPSYKLQVEGAAGHLLELRNTTASKDSLLLNASAGVSKIIATWEGTGADEDLAFLTTTAGGTQTEKLRILANGNVGIGTTAPSSLLHLNRADTTRTDFRLENDQSATNQEIAALIFSGLDSGSAVQDYANITAVVSSPTAGSEQGRLDFNLHDAGSSGARLTIKGANVGIGTTSPQGPLHISSADGKNRIQSTGNAAYLDFYPANSGGNNRNYRFVTSYNASGLFQILQGASEGAEPTSPVLAINSSGNVGIGTTNPGSKLEVNGDVLINSLNNGFLTITNSNTASGSPRIVLNRSVTGSPSSWWLGDSRNTADFDIYDNNSSAVRMTVQKSTGNVGLGTTNPADKLEVNGRISSIASTAAIRLQSTGSNDPSIIDETGGNQVFRIGTLNDFSPLAFQTTNIERMRIDRVGNLGIGITTPSQKLTVGASSTEYFQVRTTNAAVGWNAADATLYVGKDATTSRSINAAGSVNASGADYAEYFATSAGEGLVPGELACLAGAGLVQRCPIDGSAKAVGVVSTQPAFVGNDTGSFAGSQVLIGLAGQVPVNVSSENGPVQVGDYLTLSSTQPGRAMKATKPGWVIGKVLAVNGSVLMLIQSTYYVPSIATILQSNPSEELIDLNMTDASAFGKLVVTDTLYVGAQLVVNGPIKAKQLCLDEVCIDKDQLRSLLNQLHRGSPSSSPTPPPQTDNSDPSLAPSLTPPSDLTPPVDDSVQATQ